MKIAIVNLITRTSLCRNVLPEIQSNRDAMIVKFVEELRSAGAEADLFVSDSYKPVNDDRLPINIHYLPTRFKKLFLPSRIPFTPSLVKALANSYDIVVCSETFQWSTVLAVLAKIFSFKRRMKVVVWQEIAKHQKIFGKWPSIIYHKVILKFVLGSFIDAYIPRGKAAAEFLKRQGINPNKITAIVPHGIDQKIFFSRPGGEKERYLFSPSRLVESKGIDILLQAFAMVCQDNDDVKLIIQGEGPLKEQYKALSKLLDIDDRVSFDETRLDHNAMRQRYQRSLATVISSREDLTIFSDMESISCGTPVVISSGVDSHINYKDGKGGASFNNGDYQQLAGILKELIRNPSMRRRMETEAVRKSERFHNSRLVREFMNILQEIKGQS